MFVRLTGLEIYNFKNVEYGKISFPNHNNVLYRGKVSQSDITGIYGQNGSGKTAVVEVLAIAKDIISGQPISFNEYSGIINENARIVLDLFIDNENTKIKVRYEVKLKVYDKKIGIPEEALFYCTFGATWKSERFVKVNNPYYNPLNFTNSGAMVIQKTKNFLEELDFINNPDKLAVSCASLGSSFLFNDNVIRLFEETEEQDEFKNVVCSLYSFAQKNFFVIKVNQLAQTNSQVVIPLNIYFTDKNCLVCGCLPILINGTGTVPKAMFDSFKKVIESINIALGAIVPNLKLEPIKIGEETDSNGLELIKLDMFSNRDGKVFSTKYESEGIKRIISLLSCLIAAFNDPATSLVIDELDSGIFEYLLGELLGAMDKEAKGQIIFTSHNLRAFEKLSIGTIYCSTTNPQNRYIKLTGINTNNNRRDFYIRSLVLGGQKEELYSQNGLDNIGYAFRKAGIQSKVTNG